MTTRISALKNPSVRGAQAAVRQIPLSDAANGLMKEWKRRARSSEPTALVFSTRGGTPISPNNVLRRAVFPACESVGLPHATWLTFRRTYSSWSHDKGVPGKVIAQYSRVGADRKPEEVKFFSSVPSKVAKKKLRLRPL
jgi:integrase